MLLGQNPRCGRNVWWTRCASGCSLFALAAPSPLDCSAFKLTVHHREVSPGQVQSARPEKSFCMESATENWFVFLNSRPCLRFVVDTLCREP